MVIIAKFPSTCPLCQRAIVVGDKVDWTKGEKARHVECPTTPASKPPTRRRARTSLPPAFKNEHPRAGAISVTMRYEACKRHELPSFVGDVRRLNDASAASEGCRYYVVETQSAQYASASQNEDFHGEYGGACWWITLGGRSATPEEGDIADRDHRAIQAGKVLAQLPRWVAEQVRRGEYHAPDTVSVPSGAWAYPLRQALAGSETMYLTEDAIWYVASSYDDGPRLWRRPISNRDVKAIVEMVDFICR